MRLKIVNDRKDDCTVTIHILHGSEAVPCLYKLFEFYLESGYKAKAVSLYGFAATSGNNKVLTYIKGGKKR